MKFSENWVREWVNPNISTEQLVEQLTMAGLEVDSFGPVAPDFNGVVVGRILSVEPHPNADKLRVCRVDVGEDEPLSIVCGASNARVDLRSPTATVGALLPGNFKIKKSKLRGVPSHGMMCSAKELGLAESSEGIMELPADAPVGESIQKYLALDDQCIDVELTPNRGDCLNIAGIAREIGVLNRVELSKPEITPVKQQSKAVFPVQVDAPADCPRYLGRVVKGINVNVTTPIWLQERLRRGGIRSLGPVVDVTNYILLELGQPMHAFDLDQLTGSINVRRAWAQESITLLDGKQVQLDADTLLITDEERPLAIAGIMGGLNSGVTETTKDIMLECAFFAPVSIAGRARKYGLQTDSSHRFERGVDPESQYPAMERATKLLQEIVGGEAGPITEVSADQHLPAAKPIQLRRERLARLLGVQISSVEVTEILSRLEMDVAETESGWQVIPPSFRFDIEIEADLVEEIGRIYGYNNIPSETSHGILLMGPQSEGRVKKSRISSLLVDRGYQEVITYSFVDPKDQKLIDPNQDGLSLANPISSEMAVMRTTLWTGLLNVIGYNLNRQIEHLRLFEIGMSFTSQHDETQQVFKLAGAVTGAAFPEQWGAKTQGVDFFDVKSDLEALIRLSGQSRQFEFVAGEHAALHPGQTAEIRKNGHFVGWLGVIHPKIQKKLEIDQSVVLFELELTALQEGIIPSFTPLSKFPSIRRDIAVIIDEQVSTQGVKTSINEVAGDWLQEIVIFDVYRGKGIDSGRKSIALGLILQDSSRTLTDEDVDGVQQRVVARLQSDFAATLRD